MEEGAIDVEISDIEPGTRIGYKIIGWETDGSSGTVSVSSKIIAQAFAGQKPLDWSATYLNSSIEVALGYLPTKFETFDTVALVTVTTKSSCQIARPNEAYYKSISKLDSSQQAKALKSALGIPQEELLLQTLGYRKTLLVTQDAQDREVCWPHSLSAVDHLDVQALALFHSRTNKSCGIRELSEYSIQSSPLDDSKLSQEAVGVVNDEWIKHKVIRDTSPIELLGIQSLMRTNPPIDIVTSSHKR